MSDTTAELALKLAVDADDTADYLTQSLRSSLNTLDGVFNSTTGHNHNGAHQGGNLVFSVLNTTSIAFANGATLGPFSTGNQLRFQSTNVSFSGNATIDGTLTAATMTATTFSGTPNFSGAVTMGSTLTVAGATTVNALLTATSLNVTGAINAAGIGSSGDMSVGRDFTVTRNEQINGQSAIMGNLGVGTNAPQVRLDVLNGFFRIGAASNPQPPTSGFGIEITADASVGLGSIGVVTRSGGAVASRSPLAINGDVTFGSGAPAVSATTGFPRLPFMAGAPTGVPDTSGVLGGHVPIVVEASGTPKIWVRIGSTWRYATLT